MSRDLVQRGKRAGCGIAAAVAHSHLDHNFTKSTNDGSTGITSYSHHDAKLTGKFTKDGSSGITHSHPDHHKFSKDGSAGIIYVQHHGPFTKQSSAKGVYVQHHGHFSRKEGGSYARITTNSDARLGQFVRQAGCGGAAGITRVPKQHVCCLRGPWEDDQPNNNESVKGKHRVIYC